MTLVDPDTKRAGLMAIVASGGSVTYARNALLLQDRDVALSTLHDWKTRYADEIQQLHDRYAPAIEKQLVRQSRDIAIAAHETALLAIDKTREALEAGTVKDPAATARNLEVTAATAIDKTLVLTGRPDSISSHRNPDKLLESLAAKGITVQIGPAQPETQKQEQDSQTRRSLERAAI